MEQNKEEIQKICKNCKEFQRHYIRSGIAFHKMISGHCCRRELIQRGKSDKIELDTCDRFEARDFEKEKEEEQKRILSTMQKMSENVEQILQALKIGDK
ncbi:MAG: hypothetical protein IJY62_04055 [Clostridia bacterium]|nr:hypothetical protein [Clostridia bacterium]